MLLIPCRRSLRVIFFQFMSAHWADRSFFNSFEKLSPLLVRFFSILSPILFIAATAGQSFGENALALTLTTTNITEPPVSDNPSITLGSVAAFCPGAPSFSLDYSAASGSPVSYSISAGTPAMTGFIPVDVLLGASPLTIPLPDGVPKGTYQFIITVKNAAGSPSVAQTFSLNFDDTQPPVLTCTSFSVADPSAIPASDMNTGITATASDNCGTTTIELVSENYVGLNSAAGFCPSSVERTYVAKDQCGNISTECTQTITVVDHASCAVCQTNVPFYAAMLNNAPDSLWTSPPNIIRDGICCGAKGPPSPRCISFNIYLDKDAVGLIFDFNGAGPRGSEFYQIDCGPPVAVGSVICLTGGRAYTVTFCKPGNNANTYWIQSISGLTGSTGLITRADANCAGQLSYTGVDPATVTWKVKGPAPADQTLLRYLSCTTCLNPIFTPDRFTPLTIVYEVCGTILGTNLCNGAFTACKDVTITTLPAITIAFDINLGNICATNIPTINTTVLPISPYYTYQWFSGPDGTGSLLSTNSSWKPTAEGSYSLIVTETHSGVQCKNSATYNFNIAFDTLAPIILAPPAPLVVECNDSDAAQHIINWLATASATDGASNIVVTSDYHGITMACNQPPVTVTFFALDQCGNESTTTSTIKVTDTQPPTWTIAAGALNRTISCSDAAALIAAQVLIPSATDNCDITLTPVKTVGLFVAGSCPQAGTYTNTWRVTDACGNVSAVYTQTITITDIQAPTWATLAGALNQTVPCFDVAGKAAAQALFPLAVDNCDPTPVLTKVSGSFVVGGCPNTGTYTNTWTAKDACNNTSVVFTQIITITDNQPPIWTTLAGNLDRAVSCSDAAALTAALAMAPVATDLCDPTPTLTKISGAFVPGSCPQAGSYTNTWTAKDACNNTSTVYTQVITTTDTQAPVITCPANATGTTNTNECFSTTVVLGTATATDNCSTVTITNNAPAQFPTGTTTVTWTATDACGNAATCTQTVTITDNNQPPVINCPADKEETIAADMCSETNVILDYPVITDNCPNPLLSYTLTGATLGSGAGSASGLTFNIGKTRVHYTATDVGLNTDTCSFQVWIKRLDIPPTVITCPANPTPVDAVTGLCTAPVTVASPVINDPCNSIISVVNSFNNTNNASGNYPVGITTVIWTITDNSGNVKTCTQTITVTDTQAPDITCQTNVEEQVAANNCSKTGVNITNPVITDNCPNPILAWTLTGATTASGTGTIPAGQVFNVGKTRVHYTVTDASANTDTCSIQVWIKSLVLPQFKVTCPAITTITQPADAGRCDANVTVPAPTFDNPCNEAFTMVNSFNGTNNANGIYPIGSTTVTWTVTDASGNVTTCTQTITVKDNIAPTLVCPDNVTQTALPGPCLLENVIIPDPVATDNCSVLTQTWTMSGATTGSSPATGIHSVSGQTFNVGTTTVTYTVADAAGNIAPPCSFTVLIKSQNKLVVTVGSVSDIIQAADPGQCSAAVTVPKPIVTDPCNESYTVTNSFNNTADASGTYPVGVTTVTWTITDFSGNVTTEVQKITVNDLQKPVLTCPGDVTQTALPGNCSLDNVIINDPTYADNCSVTVLTWTMTGATMGSSPATGINSASGQTYNVGITTVTYTASDAAGNKASCTFNVWIKDLLKPVMTLGCPADVVQSTDPVLCTANVTIPKPVVSDPCNEGYTIVNSFNGTDNASGIYPGGVTNVVWTITDFSGNVTICTQKVTINSLIPPTIVCPANFVQTALPGNCSLSNVVIPSPTITNICPIVTQTWIMTGATTGNSSATGINNVSGQTFNTGITNVIYTVIDAGGQTASCSFDVWIKDLVKPVMTSGCPADMVQTTDPGQCTAFVTVPKPLVTDPCNEGYSIINNHNNTDNASGTFPLGTTIVVWTITDLSGNNTTCSQNITINDRNPTLACPSSLNVMADFEKMYASNVSVPSPTFGDDCPGITLTWTMTGVNTGSSLATGVNIFPATYTFNVGVSTIQYNLEDANGHKVSCPFTVTVEAKPDITCQPDTTKNGISGICRASIDPGFPIKVAGAEPITYTWTMSGASSESGTGPVIPNPYSFNVGVTTITWTATNISGSDVCTQTITITDNEIPTMSPPAPLNFCVENLISAAIVSNLMQLSPTPDYYLFKKGSTVLDINPADMSDNCTPSNQLILYWKIDFSVSTPTPSVSGTGQPSAYTSDIIFPGDGSTFKDVIHTMTYWVVDQSGNESIHKSVTITIHPRPVVSYHDVPELLYSKIPTQKFFISLKFLFYETIDSFDAGYRDGRHISARTTKGYQWFRTYSNILCG